MQRKKRLLTGFLCALVALTGCQAKAVDKEVPPAQSKQEENQNQSKLDALQPHAYGNIEGLSLEAGSTISIIGRGEKSAYWTAIKEGAQEAVDELNQALGYKGEDKIVLTYSAPETENDVDGQVNILDEELARYPAAVGIALADAAASEVQFDLAAENGIPVVAFDSGTDYKNVVCMVDTDNIEAAQTAADKLCDAMNDEGEVLVFVHDSNSTSAKEREEGFVNAIAEAHAGVSVANVYHMDDLDAVKRQIAAEQASEDAEAEEITTIAEGLSNEEVIRYLLEKHTSVRGIYSTSESVAKAVIAGVQETEQAEEYKIVSFDGGENQLERLKNGELTGLVVQNPYGIGYATVVSCVRAVMGEGNEAVVDAGFTWVTANNMDEEAIINMMY